MEDFTNKTSDSEDRNEFQEDGNDSDLEGRLYAEIYYSNEVHDSGENFNANIKTIQDIKNSSQASNEKNSEPIQNTRLEFKKAENPSNSSEKSVSPRNNQTDLVSPEEGEVSSHMKKNLNLQKQVNLKTKSGSFLREDVTEVIDENMNPQEKLERHCTPQQKTHKQKTIQTPEIMNEESENSCTPNSTKSRKSASKKKKKVEESPQALNNSFPFLKARKRTCDMDKDSSDKSKKRSLESDRILNNTPKSVNRQSDGIMLTPVSLNARMSTNETHFSPLVTPATMAILFSGDSKKSKRKRNRKKKKQRKKQIKATKLKELENKNEIQKSKSSPEVTLTVNSTQFKEAQKLTQEVEIVEIISSDSSDEFLPIVETPKTVKGEQDEKSIKEMPTWLDACSDSEESIFEVPVPPKPSPPIIDLNDSEGVSSDSDESSSDGIYDVNSKSQTSSERKVTILSSSNSTSDSEEISEDKFGVSKKTLDVISVDNSTENSVESSEKNLRSLLPSELSNPADEASDSSYSDFPVDERMNSIGENLILNCTEVQKGAGSLEEIKKRNKVAISDETEENENENIVATEYNEYIEPLNDLAKPSTSTASGPFAEKKCKKMKNIEKKRKSSKEKTDEEYFFEPMSDQLKAFYNNSWGGEEFSIEETQKKMRKDPRCWAILDEDWKPSLLKRQRYFLNKNKCTLCRQTGHLRANCPEPKKGPVCHMCGSREHYETRCPDKLCLTCGTKQNTFRQTCESCRKLFCTLCRSRGHKKDSCPDHWRQYHHTTNETEHQPPKNSNGVMKPANLLFCCNCTMRGHESSTCNKYRWTQHYSTPSHITNYYKCTQLLPTGSFKEPKKVVNLAESPDESTQNLICDVECENISNEEASEAPGDYNSATASNSEANTEKILFESTAKNIVKSKKKLDKFKVKPKHEDSIVLSDVQNADLEGLIAGMFIPGTLTQLSRLIKCDICIKLVQGTKVVMNISYHSNFTKLDVLRKFIFFWVQLSDQEKKTIRFYKLEIHTPHLVDKFKSLFKKFDKLSGDIQILYKKVKSLTNKLKERTNTKKGKKIHSCIRAERKNKLSELVQLLYKNNCAVEKDAVSNLRKLYSNLNPSKQVSLDVYIQMFYYYCLIFSNYEPRNLEEMVQNYLALNESTTERSIDNLVASGISELDVAECKNVDFDDQEHPDSHVDQNYVYQEPVQRNLPQNRIFSSIPSFLESNRYNSPPQFYPNQSIPTPSCSNFSQSQNRRSNQFEFPVEDFIPISNHYRPSEFPEPHPQFNRSENSRQFARNPMHNFRTFNPRAPQTSQRLTQEASYLMDRALQLNVPHITKAGHQLEEIMYQNRLQRKHINYFRHLINSEYAKGFR